MDVSSNSKVGMVDFVNSTATTLNGSNSTPYASPTPYHGYDGEEVVSAIFSSILGSIILIGNGMVIAAYHVNPKLHNATNKCFVNLAVCDLLVGLISMPLWTHYMFNTYNPKTSNANLYLFYISFDIFIGAASIFQLTFISLERCFSIIAPVRHRSMPVHFYNFGVIFVWLLALFSSLLRLLPYNEVTSAEWYNIYTILVCFVLPVLTMNTAYTLLFKTAMKRSRLSVRSNRNLQASWSSQAKTITTLLIVTGLFIAAWFPFFLYITLARYLPEHLPSSIEGKTRLWRFVKWMHYGNSAINPFVYAFRNREFSSTFKMILYACIKRKRFEEVYRQFKRSNLRRHTREEMSFSQSFYPQSSRRESCKEPNRSSRRTESIRLNTVAPNEALFNTTKES